MFCQIELGEVTENSVSRSGHIGAFSTSPDFFFLPSILLAPAPIPNIFIIKIAVLQLPQGLLTRSSLQSNQPIAVSALFPCPSLRGKGA